MAYIGNKKVVFDPSAIAPYAKGYEDGEKAAYDTFWDNHQQKGFRTLYDGAFYGWSVRNFKPKYNINVTIGERTFCYFGMYDNPFDFDELLNSFGITLDTSGASNLTCFFNGCNMKKINVVNLENATNCAGLVAYAENLETIGELKMPLNANTSFSVAFKCTSKLKNITISNKIYYDLDFRDCQNLTHNSLLSILNALNDYNDGSYPSKFLYLGTTNLGKLTDAEKAIATEKGWNLL